MSNTDKLCGGLELPEVCGEDTEKSKRKHLLSQTTNDNDGRITTFMKRDKPLLVAIVLMIILMNFKHLSYILYPFKVFSTFIHELCHGCAAILVGGGVQKLSIFPDTSGLAYTYTNGTNFQRGFVASAGYTGTAVLGMILLLFRRTYHGPTVGIIGLGILMLLSCIVYVRNLFGLVMLPIMAAILILCAMKLEAVHVGYLYSFLAATCSFNAVDNISELFGGIGYVNGVATEGDAHAVADNWGGTNIMWASLWFIFALACSAIGLLLTIDGHTYKRSRRQQQLEEETDDNKLPKNELTADPEIQVY